MPYTAPLYLWPVYANKPLPKRTTGYPVVTTRSSVVTTGALVDITQIVTNTK